MSFYSSLVASSLSIDRASTAMVEMIGKFRVDAGMQKEGWKKKSCGRGFSKCGVRNYGTFHATLNLNYRHHGA